MTFLNSQKRLGQFETLETKKLIAADLAASADVVSLNPGECITALSPGNCVSALTAGGIDPADCPSIIDPDDVHQLGGQEGEPVSGPATDIVLANLGGQEGEDVADRDTENFRSILHKSGSRPDSEDSYDVLVWT